MTPLVARAQITPGLALETNRFNADQGLMIVEGAVEIPYPLLTFEAVGNDELQAQARVETIIENESGEQVYRVEHEITPVAFNSTMAASERVSSIETFGIYLPPGEYVARARVTDIKTERAFDVSRPLVVPPSPLPISDVVLSNHVQKGIRQEGIYLPYLVGSTMFNPNPRHIFYKDAPLLYFYYEVHPEALSGAGEVLGLRMEIADEAGTVVKDLGVREIKVTADRNFDLGAFSIAGLAAGRYGLRLVCETCPDASDKITPFEVRPLHSEPLAFLERQPPEGEPSAGEPAGGAETSAKYYADLSPAQVDSVIEAIDILLTSSQQQLVATLNPIGKVEFLNRFWDSNDSEPETPANEFKQIFDQRVAFANQSFGTLQAAGIDTDRGRIYVLFGEPTERLDRPLEATVGPYEIWNYANQGQTFAFGDFRKDGSYRLIYSTDQRFPGDPTIQSLVETDRATSSPTFLRAMRGYEEVILDIRQNRVRRAAFE
ncbi:MAG: GWxTD domain-containing protein [Gemmatimonadota bacterium]